MTGVGALFLVLVLGPIKGLRPCSGDHLMVATTLERMNYYAADYKHDRKDQQVRSLELAFSRSVTTNNHSSFFAEGKARNN